jgi:hypothetical protein
VVPFTPAPPPATKSSADQLKKSLDIIGAGLSLGGYVVALGALQMWLLVENAGLPADLVLDAFSVRTYGALGARALAIGLVAFAGFVVFAQLVGARRPDGRPLAVHTAVEWLMLASVKAIAAMGGLVSGFAWTLVISAGAGVSDRALLKLLIAAGVAVLPWLAVGIVRAVHHRGVVVDAGRVVVQGGAWGLYGSATGLLVLFAEAQNDLWIAVAALGAVALPWVRTAVRLVAPGTDDPPGAIEQRLDFPSVVVMFMLAAAYLLPIWAGLYVVLFGVLLLADELGGSLDERGLPAWLPASILGRAAALGIVIAVVGLPFTARTPQRFDRTTVVAGGSVIDAAVLGETGTRTLLGVCVRRDDETSGDVALLRVPKEWVPADRVVADDYLFYETTESTLLSNVMEAFGYPSHRAESILAFSDRRPEREVCAGRHAAPQWILDRLAESSPKR